MKIALTADPELPVPPLLYGGIERIVDMLARGLVAKGHDVTLFAHRDSHSAGRLIPWPGLRSTDIGATLANAATLARGQFEGQFDIVHSFSRIAYMMPILPMRVPKLMTYQRAVTPRTVRLGYQLSRGSLGFTAISAWMIEDVRNIGSWTVIPNGVPLDTYQFQAEVADDAPLVFLGRVEEIKGPHLAIRIARESGRRLIIAGNIPDEKQEWVKTHVLSEVDGNRIQYIGPVNDAEKNRLLGGAAALLMPILWDEPFGIVMAEAMACGTPVLGLARGAVCEVVDDGITGFVREGVDGLVAAVDRVPTIARAACRARVEAHYSDRAVVESYERLYRARIGLAA
ncbi:MAG: glycosyltransferase family 4 protein [Alphaproteobacteria bacterium]|nr:glycosyltransferase family 4 protein [Alphaproteobacteria bacterium]